MKGAGKCTVILLIRFHVCQFKRDKIVKCQIVGEIGVIKGLKNPGAKVIQKDCETQLLDLPSAF